MRIAVAGASGLLGTRLSANLRERGDAVIRLVRPSSKPCGDQTIEWDPRNGKINAAGLEGCDCLIHLGGTNVASGRWTDAKKRSIRDSRIDSTALLAKTIASLAQPPSTFLCASAIGYYGNRGDETLDEDAQSGTGYLPDTCRQWEAKTKLEARLETRVVQFRIGVVLDKSGGALAKMLPPFRFGIGGRIGNGTQYMSWITLDDVVAAMLYCIDNGDLRGPVNLTTPNPVTNAVFTKTLAGVLNRPAILPLPAFAIKILFGEMGRELLLGGARVVPQKLLDHGFKFGDANLETALRRLLNGP